MVKDGVCISFGICHKDSLSPVRAGDSVGTRVGILGGFGNVLDSSCKFWVHGAAIFNGKGKDLDFVGDRYCVPVFMLQERPLVSCVSFLAGGL